MVGEEEVREVVSEEEAEGVKENQLLYDEAGATSGLADVAWTEDDEAGEDEDEDEEVKEEKRLETEDEAPCTAPVIPPLFLL